MISHRRVADYALQVLDAIKIANPNPRKDLRDNSRKFVYKLDELSVRDEVFFTWIWTEQDSNDTGSAGFSLSIIIVGMDQSNLTLPHFKLKPKGTGNYLETTRRKLLQYSYMENASMPTFQSPRSVPIRT